MADIKGNNKQVYDYLSSAGVQGIGNNADEFQKFMEKDDNRRQVYDYLSSSNVQGLGNSYEEFSSFVYDGGRQNAKPQPVQATEPVKSESQKRTDRFNAMVRRHEEANGHVPGEEDEATEAWAKEFVASRGLAGYERRKQERNDELSQMVEDRKANEAAQKVQAREQKAFEAAEGLDMFNEMRGKKGETTVAERAAELTKDQPERLGENVEGKTAEELDQIKHSMGLEQSFTKEYEKRRAEYAEHMKEYASVRGDARNVDFSKYEEEREWLKKNEAKYNDMKGRLDNVQSKFLELTTPNAMSDLDEAQKANRDQMAPVSQEVAAGYTPFGGSAIGETEESREHALRKKADEIYNMTRQTLNQGSKYDKGYEGNGMEQAATAIRQFIQGGINNVDKGSLTMGLSEGMALMEARKVGDKYNGIITDTIKDLGYSDRDVTRMMSDLEKKTKELEPVAQELERSRAEIDVMQSTLDEMIANGADESKIRSYTKELNKQINEYNKKIKDSESLFADYKKTRDQYDEVSSAVEAAIQGGLTGGEQAILDAVQQYTKAKYLRSNDVSKAAAAGAGLEDTLEFMLGFILTGGLEKAGTKAATKLTMRSLEKKLGKRVGTDLIEEGMKKLAARGPIKASLGYKALTDAGVAAVRTLALPTRNIQTYGEQLAEYADVDKLGRLQFNRSKVNALANTAYQNFVDNWSEGFGTYLSAGEQKLFRLATGNAPKVAIGKTLQSYRGSIGNYLDHGKFDGLFNEMMEEVGGSGLNWFAGWLSSKVDPEGAGIGDKEALSQFFAGEQLATTFLSFLPLSAIGAATNISAYNRMARRYDESVAKLNPLIESKALDADKLEKIANEISGMTPERATKRIIELGEETRKKNHGELPEDFAPAVMGYIQGKYAMDLRHDEWEDSREKMAVVQAYASAYEKPDLRNAWDSRQAEQETRAAAVEAGFTDEELDRNAYVLAQDAASIRETDPERSQVLSNYANAKSARAGLVDSYSEAGRKAEEEFGEAVRQNLSRDGIVISAQVQENGQPKTVYITTKGVKINNDGTVSTPTGVDGPILYRDSATGEQKKVMASQLSGAEVFETENFIREANEADADVRARAFEAAENTVSMTGRVRAISSNIGNNVVVRRNGVYAPVKIERMTNGGLGVVISGDKKALQGIAAAMGMQVPASQYLEAPVAQFYNLLSKEQDGSLTTFNEEQGQAQAPAQVQGAPAQAAEEVPEVEIKPNDKFTVNYKGQPREVDIDQANDTEVWFSYTDENGNEATGVMTPYDFRESIVTEGAPVQEAAPAAAPAAQAPATAPAQAAFPVDENGNRIYDDPSVSPQAAYDEIYNGVEAGSRNEANRNKFVAAKAAKAAKDVEDARNRIAGLQARKDAVDEWEISDDEELDAFEQRKAAEKKKYDDEIARVEAGLSDLQRRANHWASVRDMASAVASVREALERDARLVARADNWSSKTGVKVRIFRAPDEVDDKSAKEAIERGEPVGGWFNPKTGEVGLYLPNLANETEVDKTFIHEVISHKGLRDLLGSDNYNALCDKVWDQLMSQAERDYWKDEYNAHLKDKGYSDEFLRRAAADEWIAHFSEGLGLEGNKNIFDKFVEFVKEFIDRILGEDSKITKEDIESLLRSSLANYEARRNEARKAELTNSGIADNGDDTRFSVRYVPTQDEVGHIAKDISTTMGIPEDQARKWLQSEMSLAAIITGYQEFLNYKADDRYTAIKNDSDYPQGTVDFNNICRKRLDFTEMYQRIQRAFPNTIITGEDLATIRNIMKRHGLTVACGLCYVEDRRQLLGEIAKDFIDNMAGDFKGYESKGGETKKKNAEKFRSLIGDDRKEDLSIYDLITLDGSTRLNQEHPGIYKAFQAFNAARGQQAGNLFQGYAEYKHEILDWSDAKVKRVNDNGGLRIFSYSDFEAHHLIDIVQIVIDCARRGVKIQGYTKVPAFARAVANTGIKLNRSLIPLGDTGIVDGKLAYDPVEGIDINDPDFLESNDNIGNILIGINDEQIRLAMADPFVHYIIPYHSNQSGVLRGMKQTGKWTNYKNEQTEKGENVGKHGVNIYTDVLNAAEAEGKPITNEREFTEKFLAVCKEKGWTPRFARFLNTNDAGDYVYTPGYYKLLLDFKLFDENGNILPQKPVVAEFDDAFNAKILMDYVAEQEERKTRDLDPVYEEILDELDLEDRKPESIDDGGTRFRKVVDPAKVQALESGPKVKVYRSMQFIPDPNGDVEYDLGDGKGVQKGFLYAPMSAKVDGKWRDPIRLGMWEEAEENPDLADENGDFYLEKGDGSEPMKVAYAPYLHTRRSPLNEQFSSAYKRGNLVIVESEIPESELTSNYTAEKSKKSTGEHDWPSGKVSNALAKKGMDTRKVILSRWAKPIRLVPNSEVADEIVKLLGDSKLAFPYNVVTPGLRSELKSRGVQFKGWQGNKPKNVNDLIAEMERSDDGDVRFRKANQTQNGFISNAEAALDRIKMDKATPEQWVKMLEKEGGLKAGEDKWIGLSDWLNSQDKKSIAKDEIDEFIEQNRIQIEETRYVDRGKGYDDDSEGELLDNFMDDVAREMHNLLPDMTKEEAWGVIERRYPGISEYFEYDDATYDVDIKDDTPWDFAEEFATKAKRSNGENTIHPTRLNYTTEGLDNKREIALTVPTIEPWNENDEIHFGDAGNGRAVAWARFGETTDENGKRVLVIDEIQSKRHQEAREQGGYKDDTLIKRAEAKMDAAKDEYDNYVQGLVEKYGGFNEMRAKLTPEEKAESNRLYSVYQNARTVFNRNGFDPNEDEEYRRLRAEQQAHEDSPEFQQLMKDWTAAMKAGDTDRVAEIQTRLNPFQLENQRLIHKIEDREVELADEFNETHKSKVAAAPFEKNWHELAMKRMLRLAAEEGYDYVAWTTGDQQADRYNIGGVVKKIKFAETSSGKRFTLKTNENLDDSIMIFTDGNGNIVAADDEGWNGKTLSDIVGKEMAVKMLSMNDGEVLDGEDLRVGGEGMRGFYDDILPRFMNKYGKKWGVKVQDITLPNVEEAGRVMHAVPVTQEMKDSVMEGQTMFRKAPNGKESNLTDEQWEMVRTPEFKAWFGDWENDPANASKVVDENGEPMVVYHGTRWDPMSEEPGGAVFKSGWFTGIKQRADGYGEPVSVFLDIKNPIPEDVASDFPGLDLNDPSTFGDYDGYISYIDYGENRKLSPLAVRRLKAFYPDRYEQLIEEETAKLQTGRKMFSIIPRDPSQIKSATNNNGQFDPNNPDIRFRKSTVTPEQDKEYMDAVNAGDMEKAQQMVRDAFKAAYPDTKVVDENGNPMVVYHGTHTFGFTEFEQPGEPMVGMIWATPDRGYADAYTEFGDEDTQDEDRGVYDLFMNLTNPLVQGNVEDVIGSETWDGTAEQLGMTPEELFDALDHGSVSYEDAKKYYIYEFTRYDDFVNLLTERGFDGVTSLERGGKSVAYAAVNPNQVKSADPVTRDDNGNVIPLSERFNEENNDIRFRRAAPMTEEQKQERRIEGAGRMATVQAFGTMPAVIKSGVNGISRDRMPDGHKTDKGYYDPDNNNVYVCMDNVADERDAVATVVHETVGYKGLQELLGDRFNDMMTGVYAALDNEGRTWVNAYIARNGLRPGDAAVVRGMEEYLARTAERDGGDSLENVNEVLSKIVGDLFGVADFEFTDRELAYILRASYEHSVNPGWLDTPVGRAKDTLMKRELGINETDPNKPTDPDGGTRFRKEVGDKASQQYTQDMDFWLNKMIIENQNADLPVKIGMQRAMQEVYGDNWEEKMRELPESQDYLMRHNEASSRADTEAHNFMLFHYEPMVEQVKEIRGLIAGRRAGRKAKREAYQRVLDYMYAVSGLERNEWERANGGEQKDWSGITSLMGYKDKDQWQEAEADAREMIDQFRTQLRDAVRKDGQTDAEAQADADAMLNELWNLVQSCTDFSLDHAYKYGLLTRDEYERLRGTASKPRMWDHYLPLRGFSENTAEDVFGYATLSGNGGGEVVEHAKGRWTEADNPLANILNIAQREIVHGNENWARQALLNFTVNLGKNSLLSERNPWYVKVPGTKKWQLAYPEPIVDPATNEQTGTESIEDFEARMQELKAKGEARQGRKGLKIDQIMTNKGHRNQHLIHVKIGGSDRMIWVNGDPTMARAVSGYGKKTSWKLFRGASRVLSNLFTTYSLDFTAKNLIRDSVYSRAALLMKEDQNYRWHFLKNWWNNFGYGAFAFPMVRLAAEWDSGKLQQKQNLSDRERMFIEFMHDGGQTGYTVVRSVEKLKKDLEKTMAPRLPKRLVDWAKVDIRGVEVPILGIFSWGVRTLNEAFELLTRFTTYQTSREMGRTGQRAAYDAKEISVNFNRKGAQSDEGFWGQLAAFLGGTHYFYNAGVQGFDNFLRLYKTAPVKMGATSAAIMGMGLIMPFINSMLAGVGSGGDDGGNDDWYWNLPEWVRRNNVILGFNNWYLALPLPVEFRAIYGLGDITAAAFAYQKMPNRTFGRVAGDILSTTAAILPFNPIENYTAGGNVADAAIRAVAPDILMPFVDVATNRDYTGRALMKENPFTHVVPKNQGAYASTPKALVDACQAIGEATGIDLAPGVVRDVLSNYAGGYYRFAEDIAKQMFTDVDHPRRWDDIPFLSGFTGHIDEDRSNTYVNGVLNEYKRVSQKTVLRMNLFNSSDDITEKIAYETPELLPDKAKVQRILSGKNYELGKMYYEGMKDKGTGEYHKVEKIHKSGKSAGKRYSVKEEIKIPGVETLKKRWKDAREYWATLPKGSPEAAEAYKDVTNAWHEYYNAQANLAEKLMNYEYGK